MLFSKIKLKNIELKNRVLVPPMLCFRWADKDGNISDNHYEHYKKISKSGVGMIIIEANAISKEGRINKNQIGIWDDKHIINHKKLVDIVHKNHVPVIVQINHAGVKANAGEKFNLSPSDYYFVRDNRQGKEMSFNEVKKVQNQFVQATIRAYKAGYDGVELHGCHGYLISEFMNKKVNKRNDEYGKNPEKFVVEIIDKIRKNVSNDFIIGIRLGGYEPSLEDGIKHAKNFDKYVDYINVSYGVKEEHEIHFPDNFPFKDIIYAAMEIKKEVSTPVFAVEDIHSKEKAENILSVTRVDMVNIGRGILVNYNWIVDAQNGSYVGRCFKCKKCKWKGMNEKCVGKIEYENRK